MKTLALAGLVLVLLLSGTPAAPDKRQQALDRIDRMLDAGDLEQAEKLIGFLLSKNPGDEGLLERRRELRIRQGNLEEVLAGGDALARPERRSELREACWKIVEATASGNAEELPTLAATGDASRAKALLERLAASGPEDQRRVAESVLGVLDEAGRTARLDALEKQLVAGRLEVAAELPKERLEKHADLILAALMAADAGADACRAAGALGSRRARGRLRQLVRSPDPTTSIAALGALLAIGDESARPLLEKIVRQGSPAQAVEALTRLAAHPGKDEASRLALLATMNDTPPVPRLRATLVGVVLASIESGEKDAREPVTKLLEDPAVAMDAARALGVLGDAASVPAVLGLLREPPEASGSEATAGEGLGFLGKKMGGEAVERSLDLQPRLVAALALLRLTREE
jgi:hypothetical protein